VSPVRPFGPGAPARLAVPLLLLALAAALWGCGPKAPRGDSPPAEALWAAFDTARHAARRATTGFSAAGSLNYAGADGKAMRVEFLFWGNPDGGESVTVQRPELRPVLRLDTSAGFGTPVALWREDARGIEGYYPGEGTLYAHADPRAGAARMGLGVPLALGDLAALVCGGYDGLVPARYQSVAPTPEGGFRYEFSGALPVSSLTLDATGRPVVLAGRLRQTAWTLELGTFDEAAALPEPRRLALRTESGSTAIIRIKRLERRDAPWPADRLALAVPEDTRIVPLELYETLDQ
jgi:hypothetical protein